jgi:gas vesicle protein
MRKIRNLIIVFVAGLIIGIGLGINIGKDKPLLSNPFSGPTLKQKVKKTGAEVIEKAGEELEKSGEALQKKLKK